MNGLNYISLIIDRLRPISPEKIILFGSYAYGVPTGQSDLDILVVTNEDFIPSNYAEKGKMYLRIAKPLSDIRNEFPIDLIVHTKAMHQQFIENNSLFARELLSKGKILYEKSNQ
jgi:predicted nucleotidyltransferase